MTSTLTTKQDSTSIAAEMSPEMKLDEIIQVGKILFASGFFKDLRNEEQAVAIILRGRELGIPPVASLMSGKSLVAQFVPINGSRAPQKSNAQYISDLLNELGVIEPKQRKAVATEHLGGRKAADLPSDELEDVLSAIRQDYAQEEEEVETVVVDGAEPIQTPEPVATPLTVESDDEDEPTDARAAISAALDGAGITDADQRQSTLKRQLMAVRRRKVESLTSAELATVIEGIAASAAAA
jgi:hypothetical protein